MNPGFLSLLRKGLFGLATATLLIASQSCAKKPKEAEIAEAVERLARPGNPNLFKDPRMFFLGLHYGRCTSVLDPLAVWQDEFTTYFGSIKSPADFCVYHTWILRDGPAITVCIGSDVLADSVTINFGPSVKRIPDEVKRALLDTYSQGQKWKQTQFAPLDEVYTRNGCEITIGDSTVFARIR
jgi:hypothetical protein